MNTKQKGQLLEKYVCEEKMLGSRGIRKNCVFCGKEFTMGNAQFKFRRKYCSAICIKKKWDKDNKIEKYRKAEIWRRNKGMLPSGKSSAEEQVLKKIKEKFGDIDITVRDRSVLVNSLTGRPLELDIFISSLKIAFEIDGPIHRISCYGKDRLKQQILRDKQKDILCKEKGITLIRIPFGKDINIFGEFAVINKDYFDNIIKDVKF